MVIKVDGIEEYWTCLRNAVWNSVVNRMARLVEDPKISSLAWVHTQPRLSPGPTFANDLSPDLRLRRIYF